MTERPLYAPRRLAKRAAALLAVMLTFAHTPGAALAQSNADAGREARERFQRGVELYKEGDFRAALLEFRRAYEITPNYIVLFNLGQSYYELRDYAEAKLAFESYLREGGASVSADRRRQVEAELARLATRIAYIEVRVNVDGAEVFVDDVAASTTPLATPLVVSAGRRKLTVVKAPALPVTKYLDVAGGMREVVDIVLSTPAPLGPSAGAAPNALRLSAQDGGASKPPNLVPVWVGVATTGALTTAAVVGGLLTLSARRRLEDRFDQAPADALSVRGDRDDVRRWALATDVTAGAAALAGAVTVYLFLNRHGSDTSVKGQAAPAVDFAFGPHGANVHGRF